MKDLPRPHGHEVCIGGNSMRDTVFVYMVAERRSCPPQFYTDFEAERFEIRAGGSPFG